MKQIFVKKKLFSLGLVLFVYTIIVTPLLFINVQKQQSTKSHAQEVNTKTDQISPTPSQKSVTTLFNLTLFLNGKGKTTALTNKNPLHKTVPVDVIIYTTERQVAGSAKGIVSYNASQGNYTGSASLNSPTFASGTYYLEIKSPYHASAFTPDQSMKTGEANVILPVTMIAGDIWADSIINVLDYNALIDCYRELTTTEQCAVSEKSASDLTDNGLIEKTDYDLFVREIAKS